MPQLTIAGCGCQQAAAERSAKLVHQLNTSLTEWLRPLQHALRERLISTDTANIPMQNNILDIERLHAGCGCQQAAAGRSAKLAHQLNTSLTEWLRPLQHALHEWLYSTDTANVPMQNNILDLKRLHLQVLSQFPQPAQQSWSTAQPLHSSGMSMRSTNVAYCPQSDVLVAMPSKDPRPLPPAPFYPCIFLSELTCMQCTGYKQGAAGTECANGLHITTQVRMNAVRTKKNKYCMLLGYLGVRASCVSVRPACLRVCACKAPTPGRVPEHYRQVHRCDPRSKLGGSQCRHSYWLLHSRWRRHESTLERGKFRKRSL